MGQFKATNIVTNKNYSESEMAPNAEEELLAVKPWGPQTDKQERLRPPTYNAEDYAAALRRWGRRPVPPHLETQNGTLVSTTSSSSGYASGSGEMTLRQFTSVSELLNKLRADLRLAFPSFVQEFASSPADGITLLLETLRGVQVAQNTPPSGQTGPRIGTRRAALDELGCVECLAACGERCADAPRLLIEAQPGLLALAVCLTSSLNRSRVLALQLLTRVCQAPGGHAAVSEAVSTLRLRYGEGGRFRFLAGALLAPSAAIVLRVAGVSFLNAFIKSAPRAQTRLYIQAEACEAGLEPKVLQEWLTDIDHTTVEESLTDLLRKEVNRWTRNCVDVEGLQKRASRAEETCRMLGKKILSLQNQIENLQVENMNGYNTSRDLLVNNNNNNNNNHNNNKNVNHHHQVLRNGKRSKKNSSNIDDEGISSSERSSTPEDLKGDDNDDGGNVLKISSLDNDQETTIDDVIEELRIIVKDAEEEYEDKTNNTLKIKNIIDNNYHEDMSDGKKNLKKPFKYSQCSNGTTTTTTRTSCSESTKICDQTPAITYFGNRINNDEDYNNYADSSAVTRKLSSNNSSISKSSNDGSLKILVKGPDLEEAIVPAILHPQPPKRSPPCLTGILSSRNCAFTDTEEAYNSPGEEIEEEETLGDGSDSLLSASRLKYTQNETPNTQAGLTGGLLENYVTKMNDKGLITTSKSCENLTDFKTTDAKKTIRNYNSSLVMSENSVAKSYEATQRIGNNNANFRKTYSQSSEQSNKYAGGMKYRSEIEKRKILRKASSQDRLLDDKSNVITQGNNNHQKLKRSESGIESRIRKFESLNSFENLSLQSFSRPGSVDSFNRPLLFDDNGGIKGKIMRRSESFHHISLGKKESSKRAAGGSDSGLFYVTNFDLEPVITQQIKPESLKSSNLLTKSLDRIDEGLDSMVDIILTEEKHDWKIGGGKNRSKIDKQSMKQDKEKEKRSKNGKIKIEKHVKNDKLLKNDEFYNSFTKTVVAGTKHLRNDELYSEKSPLQMQKHWSYQSELDNARKSITATENALGILSISSASAAAAAGSNNLKHQETTFCLEKNIVGNKFSIGSNHESGIYLPGRSYDAFGLSKSRFNAGKYSGNNLSTRDNNGCNNSLVNNSAATAAVHGNRNSVISPTSNHGKVTDVLSGLY